MVAHLVRRKSQLDVQLVKPHGNALEQQRKAVAAQDGMDNARHPAREFVPHIGGYLFHSGIIALGARQGGFGYADHIPIFYGETFVLGGLEHTLAGQLRQIISLAENGRANAAHHRANSSHMYFPPISDYPIRVREGGLSGSPIANPTRPIFTFTVYYTIPGPRCKQKRESLKSKAQFDTVI